MAENSLENISPLNEIALDGVRYALLRHNGQDWRLGSITPLWREEIAGFGDAPRRELLASLESRGIWLAPAMPPKPLAVMCCGLGSAWTGMGRELCDSFPAARQAVDELAELADWDLPGLMLETDLDYINLTRWQIPYLFMLEYAQWGQLRSLGLKPSLMAGHSLGELVALCLAGVYAPNAAWHLFDTRAMHMRDLEERADAPSGMLAISADEGEIAQVLARWPALHVANRNTRRQYILSGPREPVLEARKSLRKRRIPAFLLNINLAFHNPAMRILRDLSLRRLNGLKMQKAAIPMLSCVKANLYPETQPEICKYIIDLDENTVDWIASVNAMREDFGISQFLELGPQEVLCGLVRELEPGAACLYASRKGDEAAAMRGLCAALFARGYLPFASIEAEKTSRHALPPPAFYSRECRQEERSTQPCADFNGAGEGKVRIVLDLLAQACGRESSELGPHLDLRYDLGLRSSKFPLLAQTVEEKLGRSIELENMLSIVTVGDLLRLFLGQSSPLPSFGDKSGQGARREAPVRPPLMTFVMGDDADGPDFRPSPINPCVKSSVPASGALIVLCIFDGDLLPDLWAGLAAMGFKFAMPAPLLEKCPGLREAGSTLIALDCGCSPTAAELGGALRKLAREHGRPEGIFLAEPALLAGGGGKPADTQEHFDSLGGHLAACLDFIASFSDLPRLWLFQRWPTAEELQKAGREALIGRIRHFNTFVEAVLAGRISSFQVINWLDERKSVFARNEPGDMLALEIFYGRCKYALWKEAEKVYCSSAPCLDFIFPDPQPPLPQQAGLFQGCCQFSRFAFTQLSGHGGIGVYHPRFGEDALRLYQDCPWLPVSFILGAMLNGAEMLLPWLSVIAFSDLEFGDALGLPAGITRECRIEARALYWIEQERTMARMCRMDLAARELAENGRRRDQYRSVCVATCQLAARAPAAPQLWVAHHEPGSGVSRRALLEPYYSVLGYAAPWRIIEDFLILPQSEGISPEYDAKLTPLKCAIDSGEKWGYKDFLYMVEGLTQACALALALGESVGETSQLDGLGRNLEQWRCRAIGFVRFDLTKDRNLPEQCLSLQLRRSWSDANLARFDAQVISPDGQTLLTMHHLEFDRLKKREESA